MILSCICMIFKTFIVIELAVCCRYEHSWIQSFCKIEEDESIFLNLRLFVFWGWGVYFFIFLQKAKQKFYHFLHSLFHSFCDCNDLFSNRRQERISGPSLSSHIRKKDMDIRLCNICQMGKHLLLNQKIWSAESRGIRRAWSNESSLISKAAS